MPAVETRIVEGELEKVRARGVVLLLIGAWIWVAALALVLLVSGSATVLVAVILAAINTTCPTAMWLLHRRGATLRSVLAISYAVHPAIAVFLLDGQTWQMDAHLYFLVALAALAVMYDIRALALATITIAMHHLIVWVFVPALAFDGAASFERIGIHAVAMVLEFAVLATLTWRSRLLVLELAASRGASELAAEQANRHRLAAETALAAKADAERREATERDRREFGEQQARAVRRRELIDIADNFETGVTELATSLGAAAEQLSQSAETLSTLAHETDGHATDVASGAKHASGAARAVASHVTALSGAIADIHERTGQQALRAAQARASSLAGSEAVLMLADRASRVEQFAQTIGDISTQTNLVAINASIEAARFGEAGKGFSVVAGEIKMLAARAGGETRQIEALTSAIRDSAVLAENALDQAGQVLDDVARTAADVREAVHFQRSNADAIELRAADLATTSDRFASGIDALVGSADATRLLSAQVRDAATGLHGNAGNLLRSTQMFVAELRAT
ncbi:MAG: methyl-accepting chemotaxis protein [Pseudomonadota bacterium]